MTAKKIIEQMNDWAPENFAEDWDNVGLLIGDANRDVKKILVALDATDAVICEAVAGGFDFLITHHPLIYNPLKKITNEDSIGRKIITLIENKIGYFCAHTNLDKAVGGVCDVIAKKIALENISPLIPDEIFSEIGIGRVGFLREEILFSEFAKNVKNSLATENLRCSGDFSKRVKKIALCGGDGSGSRYIDAAIKQNCDVYITGDLRYHGVQEALERGINFLDITHYGGEIFVVDAIVSRLKNHAEIFSSNINAQVFFNV